MYNIGDERVLEHWIQNVYFIFVEEEFFEPEFLLDAEDIKINAMMGATAWNLKKMKERLKDEFLHFIFRQVFQCFLP